MRPLAGGPLRRARSMRKQRLFNAANLKLHKFKISVKAGVKKLRGQVSILAESRVKLRIGAYCVDASRDI